MKTIHLYILVLISVTTFSCDKKSVSSTEKEELVMYIPSEMTVLMRDMFEFQEDSKKQIENGELPLDFPEKFKKIHSAKLSDQFERDDSFKAFTDIYYTNIKTLGESNKQNAKSHFNMVVQSCIACHETTCHGPITRIKKLLIK
ncbi:MAG: hypothetical protein V3U80_09590 [Flavobacteriaceae bacterium]